MLSQPVRGSWNKSARRFIRAGFMPRKPLTASDKTSSGPYRVDVFFNIRPVCPAASAFSFDFGLPLWRAWGFRQAFSFIDEWQRKATRAKGGLCLNCLSVLLSFDCPASRSANAAQRSEHAQSAPRLDLGTTNNETACKAMADGLRAFKNQGVLSV